MTEIIKPTRGKVGYIEGERVDKYGKRKPSKVRTHSVVSGGTLSTKELERTMRETAADLGVDESRIRIEPYQHSAAPVEANPYHRGMAKRWEARPSVATEVRPRVFQRVRRVFDGIYLPKNDEEMAEYLAAFEARRAEWLAE